MATATPVRNDEESAPPPTPRRGPAPTAALAQVRTANGTTDLLDAASAVRTCAADLLNVAAPGKDIDASTRTLDPKFPLELDYGFDDNDVSVDGLDELALATRHDSAGAVVAAYQDYARTLEGPLEVVYGDSDNDDVSVDNTGDTYRTELSRRTGELMNSYRDFVKASEEGMEDACEAGGEAVRAAGGSRGKFSFQQADDQEQGLIKNMIICNEEDEGNYHDNYREDGTPRNVLERNYRYSQAWLHSKRVKRSLAIAAMAAALLGIAATASKAKKARTLPDWNKELAQEVSDMEKLADEVLEVKRAEDESNGRGNNADDAASTVKTTTATAAATTTSAVGVAPNPNTLAPSQSPLLTKPPTTGASDDAEASGPSPTSPTEAATVSVNDEEGKLAAITDAIVHSFDPVLYDRNRGWKGHAYYEAMLFCAESAPPRVLCPVEV